MLPSMPCLIFDRHIPQFHDTSTPNALVLYFLLVLLWFLNNLACCFSVVQLSCKTSTHSIIAQITRRPAPLRWRNGHAGVIFIFDLIQQMSIHVAFRLPFPKTPWFSWEVAQGVRYASARLARGPEHSKPKHCTPARTTHKLGNLG